MNHEVEINDVLSAMRETIGQQAQEIAVLKATVASLNKAEPES